MFEGFFRLEIRWPSLDFDKYYLTYEIIENKKNYIEDINNIIDFNDLNNINNSINEKNIRDKISEITKSTIIPIFEIDKISYPILYYIFNYQQIRDEDKIHKKCKEINNCSKIYINLYSIRNKCLHKFLFKIPFTNEHYIFLGKQMKFIKFVDYPCIILESKEGFYLAKYLIEKKDNNKIEEIYENRAIPCPELSLTNYFESLFFTKTKDNIIIKNNKIQFIQFLDLLDSSKMYDNSKNELIKLMKSKEEKEIKYKSIILERKKSYDTYRSISLRKEKIQAKKEKLNNIVDQKLLYEDIIEQIKSIIKIKKENINKLKIRSKLYQDQFDKSKNGIKKIYDMNDKLLFTTNTLYKFYLNEISYFFFNKNFSKYIIFPSFYGFDLNNPKIIDKKLMEEIELFYNKNQTAVSIFYGQAVYLILYISKKFNITLPYTFNFNGYTSSIFIFEPKIKNDCFGKLFLTEGEKVNFTGKRIDNDVIFINNILGKTLNLIIDFFISKKIVTEDFYPLNIYEPMQIEVVEDNLNLNFYSAFLKLNELLKKNII